MYALQTFVRKNMIPPGNANAAVVFGFTIRSLIDPFKTIYFEDFIPVKKVCPFPVKATVCSNSYVTASFMLPRHVFSWSYARQVHLSRHGHLLCFTNSWDLESFSESAGILQNSRRYLLTTLEKDQYEYYVKPLRTALVKRPIAVSEQLVTTEVSKEDFAKMCEMWRVDAQPMRIG